MEENRGKVIKEHVYKTHGQSQRGLVKGGGEGWEGWGAMVV